MTLSWFRNVCLYIPTSARKWSRPQRPSRRFRTTFIQRTMDLAHSPRNHITTYIHYPFFMALQTQLLDRLDVWSPRSCQQHQTSLKETCINHIAASHGMPGTRTEKTGLKHVPIPPLPTPQTRLKSIPSQHVNPPPEIQNLNNTDRITSRSFSPSPIPTRTMRPLRCNTSALISHSLLLQRTVCPPPLKEKEKP